jgi:DNA polymerase I-like protein with 3'-5' exonuclease and polymerase domains
MNTQNFNTITFDLECNGLTPDTIWVIVAKEFDGKTHTFSYDKKNIDEGIKFLQSKDTLIGHNIIGFDIPVIKKIYGVDLLEGKEIKDTLVMSQLFNPIRDGGHSLKIWGHRVGASKMESPEQWDKFDAKMIPYCQQDVVVNELVYKTLLTEGQIFSKDSINIEHEVTKILRQQETNGFYFNEKKARHLSAQLNKRKKEVEDEVHILFKPKWVDIKLVTPKLKQDGELSKSGLSAYEYSDIKETKDMKPFMRQKLQEFNLGSRKQIGEYLTDFGWIPNRFTPTGQPIIDEATLNKIKHIPEAKLIAEFLLLQKRIAQINSWIDESKKNRVHGRVISTGTITNRMSHRSPNMAQVPNIHSPYGKECRSCWTVPTAYKLVGIDASGLELRMLAHYMNDSEYTNEIIHGDIHAKNQKTAGLKTRDNSKTFIYALMYGAGDAKIGAVVGGNKSTGKQLRKRFFDNQPSFKILRDKVMNAAQRKFLKGLDGRKIYVRYEHAALNTLLQSAGAIVMKKALIILNNKATEKELDYKFVANIHDEWQVEVKAEHAEQFGKLGVLALAEAGRYFKLRCPLDGEYKIGEAWHETH